jgi:UDP-N-acetylmuramate dehydrogenase
VNYGNATGQEILAVAHDIQETVLKTYGIAIQAEVNIF